MAPQRLSDTEIDSALEGSKWSREGDVLVSERRFPDFATALAFVNQVGEIAEDLNHHPDIALSWGRVGLSVTTHSAGGLTDLDLRFARSVDQIPGEQAAD